MQGLVKFMISFYVLALVMVIASGILAFAGPNSGMVHALPSRLAESIPQLFAFSIGLLFISLFLGSVIGPELAKAKN